MAPIHPSVPISITLAGLASAAAIAQVHDVAITIDDDDYDVFGTGNTDASLGVNDEAICITTNMELALFSRTGSLLDARQVDDGGPSPWPFRRIEDDTDEGPSRFFDPQSEYDPHSGRLWVVYSEENLGFGSADNDISALHFAVSKEMVGSNELDTLDEEDWWYYTGTSTHAGNGGAYFNLFSTSMTPYRTGGGHGPYLLPSANPTAGGLADKPHMAIDEQAAYIQTVGGEVGGTLLIIPLSHGSMGADSILDGDRPADGDLVFMRFQDLDEEDKSERHFAVQEPWVETEFLNAQFFLSLLPTGAPFDVIRIGGLYYDDDAQEGEDWVYRQRVDSSGDLEDMVVNSGFDFFTGYVGDNPETPDDGCSSRTGPDLWDVWRASDGFIPSAVLAYDGNDNPRIFAAHGVAPVDDSGMSSVPEEQIVIQWYVIDPDIDDLRDPNATWDPEILVTGRIDTNEGDHIHPVIGVTPQGVAYIEYTYIDDTVWPQVRRAQLSGNYASVASNVLVQVGPETAYAEGSAPGSRWADFADMQADPSATECTFWSVHTLVTTEDPEPCEIDSRDVWLFETDGNCGNANLNFDPMVDLYDMALFNSYYAAGARRVDMNTDGTTDAADAAEYADAYEDQSE